MKVRKAVAVMSAALIGATAAGFAQAGPYDGYGRGDRHYGGGNYGGHHGYERSRRGGDGLALALGIGIVGAMVVSHALSRPDVQPYAQPYSQPYVQPYAQPYEQPYAQSYGYAPSYAQPSYGYSYGAGPGYGYGGYNSQYGYPRSGY